MTSTVVPAYPALPSASWTGHVRKKRLSMAYAKNLDRVNVLGKDREEGHTGCVNALAWARNGELLLSGGDDQTVRIWKLDTANTAQEYPFTSRCEINTGHTANIFSAQMLPHSSRIVTAAGDDEARVFDVQSALSTSTSVDHGVSLSSRQSRLRVIRCHTDRVKRVITEDSPDRFLTVSEDGSVRQHDLRTPHTCSSSSCSAPLVKMDLSLCTLSLSPLTSYQFVVAGDGPFAYLFDRRHSCRTLEASWGGIPRAGEELTTCVRKFGRTADRPVRDPFRRDHITSVRVAPSNGHEVLVSYSGDAVYLFSTVDDPEVKESMSRKSQVSDMKQETGDKLPPAPVEDKMRPPDIDAADIFNIGELDSEQGVSEGREEDTEIEEEDKDNEDDEEEQEGQEDDDYVGVPVIKPRKRYKGARNVATVKDVNFLGPNDEWVTSGSDDGNFFIWNKISSEVHGIYEGDSSVVNMVEGHPTLPLVAVSGIDYTVKVGGCRKNRITPMCSHGPQSVPMGWSATGPTCQNR